MSDANVGINLAYEAPGPIAEAFLCSTARVQAIMGPIGSGKTGANLLKHVYNALAQRPSTRDGIRKYRLCVVRDTYRQLWQSTIKSWWRWVPRELGTWTGEKDGPATHVIRFRPDDNILIELIVDFVAIGEHKVEDVLRGYEPTAFYINEADLCAIEVLHFARGRAGRYPTMDEGGPSWWGVTLDLNAPDIDSELYKLLFEDRPEGFEVFIQPGGRDPQAENLKNLPPGYYADQASGQPDWYIRRMIDNKPAPSRGGKPVHPEFNDLRHVASTPLQFVRGLPLRLGLDAGGHPAAAFCQHMPNTQWRGIDELLAEGGTGPRRFGDDLNARLKELAPGLRREDIEAFCDPSAAFGADKKAGEDNWIEIVEKHTGLRIRAAPTNKMIPRREAQRIHLVRTVDGTQPGFVLSPKCKAWRKALNSGFRYRRLNVPGDTRYSDEPEKNDSSHIAEAGEYALLGGDAYAEVMGRRRQGEQQHRQTTAITDDDIARGRGRAGGRRERQATALDE